ncbi:hypothetical protein QCA50_016119 [Cerrena zonata]|uniref:Secreted protein n=1 Tax=Cerrena zonata TaxID=2478898 RepID=A0AAW0FP64_9APHY
MPINAFKVVLLQLVVAVILVNVTVQAFPVIPRVEFQKFLDTPGSIITSFLSGTSGAGSDSTNDFQPPASGLA